MAFNPLGLFLELFFSLTSYLSWHISVNHAPGLTNCHQQQPQEKLEERENYNSLNWEKRLQIPNVGIRSTSPIFTP
uniref:Uncharacterized protein LOC105632624 isoform X2 n=1 Tax=Rhizophora mucronata TaxID=61149 RepID=A0A2P2L6E5_RHIMU